MRKFEYLFIFIFISVTIVLLLVPKKVLFTPIASRFKPGKRLSYFQVVLLISAVISFMVLMLVKFLTDP